MSGEQSGIDFLPEKQYFGVMETVTLKMDRRQVQLLKERAEALGCSQAAVVRNLVEQHLGRKSRPSLHDQAGDLCGSVAGPRDLSARKPKGYGRD
jgi:hypothetical protein